MSDYISRETAIKKIKDYGQAAISSGQDTLDPVDDIICIAGYVEMLPAADVEPVRRWIPCSERMPERPGDYQVCTKNEYYGTKNVAKRYFNGDCWSGRWTNITHWMPLPEPPKEGGPEHG